MKLLTFDTCLNKTYVTLSDDGKILESRTIENRDEKYHSAFLISTIAEILKKYGLKMQDIDALGTNTGPGSFTGIRACVTVARVIAQQLDCPLAGVSSLEILSKLISNPEKNTAVMLDARKNQFYLAVYDRNGNELTAPALINSEEAENFKDCRIISDEAVHKYLKERNISSELYTGFSDDLGIILNNIAYKKLKTADCSWAKLKPLYLQAPPVTMPKTLK